MPGKTVMFASQKICHYRTWPPPLSKQSLSDTIAEFRTLLLPQVQTASCSSVRPILTFGPLGTKMCKFLDHKAGTLMTWKSNQLKQPLLPLCHAVSNENARDYSRTI